MEPFVILLILIANAVVGVWQVSDVVGDKIKLFGSFIFYTLTMDILLPPMSLDLTVLSKSLETSWSRYL